MNTACLAPFSMPPPSCTASCESTAARRGRVAQCHSCEKGRVVQRVQHLYSVTNKGKSLQLFRSAKNNEASALSIYWMHKGFRDLLGSAQSLVKTASW